MAEAFIIDGVTQILNAVAGQIWTSIADHAKGEISLAWGAEGELKKLEEKLGILQLVLEDAEKRQVKEPAVRRWLIKLKEVAYDAQDVMDDFLYEAYRKKNETPETNQWMEQLMYMVLNFCSRSNPFVFQWKMGHMIQDINAKFNDVKKQMEEFNFIKGNVLPGRPYNSGDDDEDRETYSSVDGSSIVGREAEKSTVIALLTDPASEEQEGLSVLPIVGMGGLGKTTLTQLVFSDEHVKNYFKDLRMWVYVSEEFDIKKLLRDVTKSAGENSIADEGADSNLQMLVGKLQRKLEGKRFLLVLDDVWNEDLKKWEDLRDALLCGAKGSKIIVTTRKNEVATLVGTLSTCHLHPLPEKDAWSLFEQRAFGSCARSEERQDLVEIGKTIVKRCGGVPLALKIIGSQLKSKGEDLDGWLYIQNNEIWNLPEIEGILRALKVSYHLLPSHLKQCFSYCSIFRKGESIKVNMLVQLWMAEGFLNPPSTSSSDNENKVLEEDVGRQYVKSLLNSCFFQEEKRNEWGEVKSFEMHDLVHDLAQSLVSSVDRRSRVVFTGKGASSATPVLDDWSIICGDRLRVLIFDRYKKKNIPSLMNLKRLRVLILNCYGNQVEELPDSIANLKHLRYLDLSHSEIRVLPTSITCLYNLQTLKLSSCYELAGIPSDITKKLINLRHLEIGYNRSDSNKMLKDISRLRFLQTLPRFKIRKERGCGISELKFLYHLRDELEIENLENVESREAAESANLIEKPKIRELTLTWSFRSSFGDSYDQHRDFNDDDVLEGLKPHRNLQGLKINNFIGVNFPTWFKSDTNMLPNLVEIELLNLRKCDHLPAFGSFPLLKVLSIGRMDSVKRIDSEFYGDTRRGEAPALKPPFPSLKKLTLSQLSYLKEWVEAPPSTFSSSSSCFPLLEELIISDCPRLRTMRTLFPMLKTLDVRSTSCMAVMMLGSSKLTSLTSLTISNIANLAQTLPGLLSNNKLLRSLQIANCDMLQFFPKEELQCLIALEELKIGGQYPPFGGPILDASLFLQILDEEKGEQFISGIKNLELHYSDIESLPKQIMHFIAVENLVFSNFDTIVDLPDSLGNLPSLQQLSIEDCKKLMHLPSVEAMRRLTTLKSLQILSCDQLGPRCAEDQGEEWHKISHIPLVVIYP